MDTTKVQHGEPMCFIEGIYKNMGRILLIGAEMTLTAISPKPFLIHVFQDSKGYVSKKSQQMALGKWYLKLSFGCYTHKHEPIYSLFLSLSYI